MKISLAGAIRVIESTPGGWVHVEAVQRAGRGVSLTLALREGKGGRWIDGWDVGCRGVHEISVSDLDGGGIRLYRSSHPAARQYTGRRAQLRCRPDGKGSAALGALAAAHMAAVEDWIPVDRYLPLGDGPLTTLVVRAPDFLVRAYAKALRGLGVGVHVKSLRGKRRRAPAPSVLHLGDSFVRGDAPLLVEQEGSGGG